MIKKGAIGNAYRYGFNGKENDNEVKGTGNQQDYGLRIYDPRLGRFISTDSLTQQYPYYTPYQFAGNNPIAFVDIDGGEPGLPPSAAYAIGEDYFDGKASGKQTLLTVAGATDINDVTVLVTMFTRKGSAVNVDNTNASTFDKFFAAGGLLLLFVSDSTIKQAVKWGARAAEWASWATKGK